MKKLVHLDCDHQVEVSKPEAKRMLAEGTKSMRCPECFTTSNISAIRVPKEETLLAESKRPRQSTRNYGRGYQRRT
jgi:hypothetical protein